MTEWLSAGPGRLIVLSGPSGVGKDTVLKALFALDPQLHYSVSYTTRPPRPGEVDGKSYSFVDEATFRAMAERGEFLEWIEYSGHLYGTSVQRVREALERSEDIVLKIEVQGAARVRRRVGGNAVFIFLVPPSDVELHRRLAARSTEPPAELEMRFAAALREMEEAPKYDHSVVNDDVQRAAHEIYELIVARRLKPASPTSESV